MHLKSKIKIKDIEYSQLIDNIYKVFIRTNIEKHSTYYEYDEYSIITEIEDKDVEGNIRMNVDKYIALAKLQEEENQKNENLKALKTNLTNSDYKILKDLENYSLGLTMPYEYSTLLAERQELRDSINNIENNDTLEIDTLSQLKERKIKEMCSAAQTTITNGIDYGDNGEHYRLNTSDQINFMFLNSMAIAGKKVPYHADGQLCRIYEPEEMIGLVQKALSWIVYHTTYYNLLKHQIQEMVTEKEVKDVYYGCPLKEEYYEILKTISEQS